MEYGVYGDLFIIYPKPYSIYLRGTIYWGNGKENGNYYLESRAGGLIEQCIGIMENKMENKMETTKLLYYRVIMMV